jgi:glycosyltransferase involved in cell wall biosynthesis
MEYMAHGKPVVAYDLPEHRVSAAGAAIYARPNDERDFATRILQLLDDAPLRKKLGEAGRMRVINELAWTHQATFLLSAYEKLLAPRLARRSTVAGEHQSDILASDSAGTHVQRDALSAH